MDATNQTNQTENSEEITTVKPVKKWLPSVYSTMTLGNVQVNRRFMAVDEANNTHPDTKNIETVDLTVRTKIGKEWWIVETQINGSGSARIYEVIWVGREKVSRDYNREAGKIVETPVPFELDRETIHASVYWGRISSRFKYDDIETSDVIGVFAVARMLNIPNKTAEELVKMIDQVMTYENQNRAEGR